MSKWITDRLPETHEQTSEGEVWVFDEYKEYVIRNCEDIVLGTPWCEIEAPETYVELETYVEPSSDDLSELETKYAKLVEAHEIALEALRYIAKLYDSSKPVYQVTYDAYAMKSEAATALERINEVMP